MKKMKKILQIIEAMGGVAGAVLLLPQAITYLCNSFKDE